MNGFDKDVDVVARALARAKQRGARTDFAGDPEAVAAFEQAARMGKPGGPVRGGGPPIADVPPVDLAALEGGGGSAGGGIDELAGVDRVGLFRRLLGR